MRQFELTTPTTVADAVGASGTFLAGGDVNYRGALVPIPLTVAGGTGQTLTMPTVD